mgnify:CR=1 FL=1
MNEENLIKFIEQRFEDSEGEYNFITAYRTAGWIVAEKIMLQIDTKNKFNPWNGNLIDEDIFMMALDKDYEIFSGYEGSNEGRMKLFKLYLISFQIMYKSSGLYGKEFEREIDEIDSGLLMQRVFDVLEDEDMVRIDKAEDFYLSAELCASTILTDDLITETIEKIAFILLENNYVNVVSNIKSVLENIPSDYCYQNYEIKKLIAQECYILPEFIGLLERNTIISMWVK